MQLQFCLLFYVGVEVGQSLWGKTKGGGLSKMGRWGRYLDRRGTKQQDAGGNFTTRRFTIWPPDQVLPGDQIKNSDIYRVAQNNVYTLWHEKYYSIIVTTVFIQKQNWYERCPWILDSMYAGFNVCCCIQCVLSVVARIFLCAHHQQCRRFRIYPEYAQLLDVLGAVLGAVFQTHSAIVAVPR